MQIVCTPPCYIIIIPISVRVIFKDSAVSWTHFNLQIHLSRSQPDWKGIAADTAPFTWPRFSGQHKLLCLLNFLKCLLFSCCVAEAPVGSVVMIVFLHQNDTRLMPPPSAHGSLHSSVAHRTQQACDTSLITTWGRLRIYSIYFFAACRWEGRLWHHSWRMVSDSSPDLLWRASLPSGKLGTSLC